LQHQNHQGELPLHLECKHRQRVAVVHRCIERNVSSVNAKDSRYRSPLSILLAKISYHIEDHIFSYLPLISVLVKACPGTMASLILDPPQENAGLLTNERTRHILLNLVPDELLSPVLCQEKKEMNWQARLPLIYTSVALSSGSNVASRYAMCKGNALEGYMLRHIVSYL